MANLQTKGVKEKKLIFQKVFAGPKAIQLIQALDKVFVKLPHLPQKVNIFFSKIIPWFALVGGIISVVATFLAFLLAILSLIALDFALILTMLGSLLLILMNALFLIKAFKPLRKHEATGWIYLFWANILGVINSGINIASGDIFGWQQLSLTVGLTLLGFYLLFEVGPMYTYQEKKVNREVTAV